MEPPETPIETKEQKHGFWHKVCEANKMGQKQTVKGKFQVQPLKGQEQA